MQQPVIFTVPIEEDTRQERLSTIEFCYQQIFKLDESRLWRYHEVSLQPPVPWEVDAPPESYPLAETQIIVNFRRISAVWGIRFIKWKDCAEYEMYLSVVVYPNTEVTNSLEIETECFNGPVTEITNIWQQFLEKYL